MVTVNESTANIARTLRESGNQFQWFDAPHQLGEFLRDYVGHDDDGWRTEFAPDVNLANVDWNVVGWLLSN